MPTKLDNPFTTLGLSTNLIKQLTPEQVKGVVESHYKALQKVYHPDMGGDEKISRKINDAYSILSANKWNLLRSCITEYRQKGNHKSQVDHLKETVKGLEATLESSQDQFMEFLLAQQGGINDVRSKRLLMYDIGLFIQVPPESSKNSAKYLYDLIIDSDGNLTRVQKNKTTPLPNKRLIGIIKEDRVGTRGGTLKLMKKTQDIWREEDEDFRRIGIPNYRPRRRKPTKEYNPMLHPAQFRKISEKLIPRIDEQGLLFSLNTKLEDPYFKLDGKITRIFDLDTGKEETFKKREDST
jgi:hypothetical protein